MTFSIENGRQDFSNPLKDIRLNDSRDVNVK